MVPPPVLRLNHPLPRSSPQDGSVRVPAILQPFLGAEIIVKPGYAPLKYIGPNQPKRC